MVRLLADNPLLLLFAVIAAGTLLGRIRIGTFHLGAAGVLFAGIAAGAIDDRLRLPDEIYELGLVLFVYVVGIGSGPAFFSSIARRGAVVVLAVVGVLAAGAGLAALTTEALGLSGGDAAGVFAGGLTNTPALAAAIDWIGHHDTPVADPVVGYSLAYPLGVAGSLLGVWLLQRRRPPAPAPIVARTVRVTRDDVGTLGDVLAAHHGQVVASRLKRGEHLDAAADDVRLAPGDLVTLIGEPARLAEVQAVLGEVSEEQLQLDRRALDMRRIFVSNPVVVGRRLGELDLLHHYGAVATRIRRGDLDLLADDHTVLELGDRLRVVAPRDRMKDVSALFGDSYRALAEVDELSFAVGVALGLLVGLVPVPLPGGTTLRLGFAGGPLVVGLILGRLGRTGPLVWQLSYNTMATLRQLGTVLFLAGIGTRSGQAFGDTIREGGAAELILAGLVVTAAVTGLTVLAGARVLGLDADEAAGALAGIQTQPAALALATERSVAEAGPSTGYSTVYPIAMITKIVLAQVLVWALT